MASSEAMWQVFAHILAQQQAQTVEIISGLQMQLRNAMETYSRGMKGAGKRNAETEGLKSIPKPRYEGYLHM